MLITLSSIVVSANNHAMKVKEVVNFRHCTQNVFKVIQPCECLLSYLSVHIRIVLFYCFR